MNKTDATLLLQHQAVKGKYGDLPRHLNEQACREYLDAFFTAAISSLSQVSGPEELAVISLGKLQGEFNAKN